MAASIVPPIDLTASVNPTLIRTLFWTAAATAGIDMGAGSSVFFRDGDLVLGAAVMVGAERLRIVGDTRSEGDIDLVENDLTDIGELLDIGGTFDMRVNADATFTTCRIQDRVIELNPIDQTRLSAPALAGMLTWDSTLTLNFASASFGAIVSASGEAVFPMTGFAFNSGSLFINGVTFRKTTAAGTMGSFFTFIGQGSYIADGVAATAAVHRDFLSQPSYSTVGIGTLAVAARENFYATGDVGAGVTITTWVHFHSVEPLTKAGTVTTEIGLEVDDMGGAGTRLGARFELSAGASKQNIQVTGTAVSTFAGDIHVNNLVSFIVGSLTQAGRVSMTRQGDGIIRFLNVAGATTNEGIDLDLGSTVDVAEWSSSTGAGFKWSPTGAADAAASLVMGDALDPDGTSNFWMGWAPGTRTVNLAGDWFDVLFSAGANVDLAGNAMGTVATMELTEPGITLSGGTVVTAVTLFVANAPTEGTTNNNAIRVGSGLTSLDTLEVRGAATVLGKLTVVGAIDPPSVLLSGGTALFYESNDGSTAAVSGAATGRIRYNNAGAGNWQISVQGGAYVNLAAGAASPWQTTATVTNLVTGGDSVTIGSAVNLGKLAVDGDANEVQFRVQGFSTQTVNLVVFETSAGTDIMAVTGLGNFTFTQQVHTTGSPTAWTFVGAAHTTLTASVEAVDMNINLSRTVQFATGALATQRAILVQAPVYAFVAASTITFAATLEITGAPAEGANATITEGIAMNIAAGGIRVAGPQVWVETTPAQFVANQNDLAISANTIQRMSTDASRTITGIVAPPNARFIIIINVGSNPLVLANQNVSSAAINRIITGTGADATVQAGDSNLLTYDTTTARWRIIA